MSIAIFNNNPELKRNVLLELTRQRLILMPLIMGLIYLISFNFGSSGSFATKANALSQLMFAIIIFGWGTWQATTSFIDEINDRTWDQQRMTSLHPITMMVGKLFGSTIYIWYGAVMALFIYFITSLSLDESVLKIKTGITAILLGILGHAVAIIVSLLVIRKNRDKSKINTRPISILCVLFALSFISYVFPFHIFGSLFIADPQASWYAFELPKSTLTLIFVIFYLSWALLGLYYLVRGELQFANKPTLFIIFLVCNAIIVTGLIPNTGINNSSNWTHLNEIEIKTIPTSLYIYTFLIYCFISAIISSYFIVIMDIKDFIGFKKLMFLAKQKTYKLLYNEIPVYILSLVFAAIVAIIFTIYALLANPDKEAWGYNYYNISKTGIPFVFAVLLFAVRDICIFLWVNFTMKARRADTLALTYLVILYVLIPILASQLADKSLLNLFVAMPGNGPLLTMIPPAIQAVVMVYILRQRFKSAELLS
ncbi:MAG: hypothetical protein SGJ10_05525 [Bacteroidota bacterium]|nr:hypothetical protein [Bacteroidota bacterium]